mmetsp:Transcript_121769/g.327055  ORF Transcript_121769/g.327055 Transcript_121769/m.327055 type:complete len:612 (-) Transcript_121769:91-1926(-)
MVWRSGSLLLASALLAAGPAAGLQRLTDEEDPLALARVIRDEIASPEDEYDIPFEIALTRGQLSDAEDPTGQLLANSEGQQSAQCEPEKRAKVAEGFLETFNRDYKPRFAAAFKGVKESAYLTVGDWRFKQMFRNFMVHAHNLTCGTSDHIVAVNVGLDKASYNECQAVAKGIVQPSNVGSKGKFELRCIDISGWLPKELFAESAAQAWSCAYNMVLWTKPHIIQAAVEAAEQPVMMIDTDVILHQNVLKIAPGVLAACKGCIAITGREYASENRQNTGTVYSGKAGLPVLREWARVDPDFLNAKEGDQSAIQSLMSSNASLRAQLAVFAQAEVGECGIAGSYATHYNCLTGKKEHMMRVGHWDTRVYREPAQLRCRVVGEPVEMEPDTGAPQGTDLPMPKRSRIVGGRKAGEAEGLALVLPAGHRQLKFTSAASCQTWSCVTNPARFATDGLVSTIAHVSQLGNWTGDLGTVMQVGRVEITFDSCMCQPAGSMLIETSFDGVTWRTYGTLGEMKVWEGSRLVAFEHRLNARYIRVRPAATYTAIPHRSDQRFSLREVEAFGTSDLLEDDPLPADEAEKRLSLAKQLLHRASKMAQDVRRAGGTSGRAAWR